MGYSWSRRLRPSEASFLPTNRHLPHLLQHSLPSLLRECKDKGILDLTRSLVHVKYALEYIYADPACITFPSSQWWPEIQHHAPNIPIILVGTKLDLRDDEATRAKLRERKMAPVSYEAAMQTKQEIGARE